LSSTARYRPSWPEQQSKLEDTGTVSRLSDNTILPAGKADQGLASGVGRQGFEKAKADAADCFPVYLLQVRNPCPFRD
jgi:hypothetical protein